ncbi:beclin-1-like protein [Blastocystis sp. subtype 4]|uniref:beclin-1-like protein n=1 Tax=Blastocystis sp. subtype 4 TaxID=944170 RepID=UPI00071213BC|nr:beclin-1-like protein [Blastocystis sp. subtype 4]KNB44268.1 beclin-1-like protein [Blastocystis sp. subtype 4]|eukprot:XP_014527711.1 beclin-1-like protein [Blastocystis sp. subtype 4]
MEMEYIDDRCPGRWVTSCQKCLNYLYLDEKEYEKFFKMYKKSLIALFVSLGYQMKDGDFRLSMVEFFEELSHLNGIDFPLCSACLEQTKKEKLKVCTKDKNVGYVLERLIGAMTVQQKMDEIKEAISPMKEEEEEVAEPEFASTAVADLEKEKSALQERIHSLRTTLAGIERQKLEMEEIKAEMLNLQDSMNCVSAEISLQLGEHEEQRNVVNETVADHSRQLDLLMHCNALNDTVNVWFDHNCITINGVRVGRIGNQIDWNSVNAALGDLIQAVDTMYRLYGLPYQRIYLKTRGSFSEVIDMTEKASYKLYFLPKTENKKIFTQALHLFLEAVNLLAKHCEEKFGLVLQFRITTDTVGGYDFLCNDFDVWMRAIRCLSIDIKQMVVYACSASVMVEKREN